MFFNRILIDKILNKTILNRQSFVLMAVSGGLLGSISCLSYVTYNNIKHNDEFRNDFVIDYFESGIFGGMAGFLIGGTYPLSIFCCVHLSILYGIKKYKQNKLERLIAMSKD